MHLATEWPSWRMAGCAVWVPPCISRESLALVGSASVCLREIMFIVVRNACSGYRVQVIAPADVLDAIHEDLSDKFDEVHDMESAATSVSFVVRVDTGVWRSGGALHWLTPMQPTARFCPKCSSIFKAISVSRILICH